MAMKRFLRINVECNEKTCGKCRFWYHNIAKGKTGYEFYTCNLFHEFLDTPPKGKDTKRLKICIDSEHY